MKRILISLVALAVTASSLTATPAAARVPGSHGVIPRYTSARLLADADFADSKNNQPETHDSPELEGSRETQAVRETESVRQTEDVRETEGVRETEDQRPPVTPPPPAKPVLSAPVFSQPIWVNSSFDFLVSSSSNSPIILTSITPLVCSVQGVRVTTTALGGVCTIVAVQDASVPPALVLVPASVNQKLITGAASTTTLSTDITVLPPQPQTIDFAQPADLKQGATNTLTATSSSGLPVDLFSLTSDVCTIDGGKVTGLSGSVGGNACTIIASQAGSDHYLAATTVTRSFKVLKDLAVPSLVLAPGAATSFNFRVGVQSSFTLQLSNSGGGASYSVDGLPAGLTFDPETGLISGSPTNAQVNTQVTVTATNGSGSSVFHFFITVDKGQATITLDPASLVLTFTTGEVRQPTITAADPNGNPINVLVTYNGSSTFPTTPGSYTVLVTCSDPNFACSSSSTLVIKEAEVTVKIQAPDLVIVGRDFAFVALVGLPIDSLLRVANRGGQATYSVSPSLPTGLTLDATTGVISGTATGVSASVTYTLTAANDSGSSSVNFVLEVHKQAQNIAVTPVNKVTYGDPDFAVVASASSGLKVSFTSSNPAIIKVGIDGKLHIVAAGRATITVRQIGDSTFDAADDQSFQIEVAPKAITVLGLNAIVDASGNVSFIGGHLQGLVPGDDVQVGYNAVSGVYRNSVLDTSGSFGLTGAGSGNYVLIQPTEISITNQTNPASAPWPTLISQPVIAGSTKGVATVGGVPVAFTIRPNLEKTRLVFSAPGWSLTMQNFDALGDSVGIGANGQMQIQLDHTIKTDGTGFAPNAQVIIYIFSTPIEIGRVLTDSSGGFSGEFAVPEGLELGQHTLQITGYSPDGQIQSANIPLELVPAPDVVLPPEPPVIVLPPVVVPPVAPTYLPKTYKVNLLFKKGSTRLTAVAARRLAIAIRLVRGSKDVVATTMGYATKSEAPKGVIPLGTVRSRSVAAMLLRTIPGIHLVLAHARTPFKGSAGKVLLSIKFSVLQPGSN